MRLFSSLSGGKGCTLVAWSSVGSVGTKQLLQVYFSRYVRNITFNKPVFLFHSCTLASPSAELFFLHIIKSIYLPSLEVVSLSIWSLQAWEMELVWLEAILYCRSFVSLCTVMRSREPTQELKGPDGGNTAVSICTTSGPQLRKVRRKQPPR